MRILVEIGHPAHVHFFRRAIEQLEKAGHRFLIITRNKDITNALLERYRIGHRCLSKPGKNKVSLVLELLWRWVATAYLMLRYRIDRAVSIAGISTSLPAKCLGIPNVVFTDTEDAKISNWIAFPWADTILTPEFFLGDLGKKQVRYNGLHELAYLQNFDKETAARRRKELGLPDKYFVIRLIKNDALHDWDIKGLTVPQVRKYIEILKPHGRIFITCEGKIPSAFEYYKLHTPLVDIHNVLEGATLFIGESPTMAVESSLLGTPAFLMSERASRLGNMVGLEQKHGLLRNFVNPGSLETALSEIKDFDAFKVEWQERARRFCVGAQDMDDLIRSAMVGDTQENALCAA